MAIHQPAGGEAAAAGYGKANGVLRQLGSCGRTQENDMREEKTSNRNADTPSDKPVSERVEHANLQRPGARAHPRAVGWNRPDAAAAWRVV